MNLNGCGDEAPLALERMSMTRAMEIIVFVYFFNLAFRFRNFSCSAPHSLSARHAKSTPKSARTATSTRRYEPEFCAKEIIHSTSLILAQPEARFSLPEPMIEAEPLEDEPIAAEPDESTVSE